jgi:hypothetical protein
VDECKPLLLGPYLVAGPPPLVSAQLKLAFACAAVVAAAAWVFLRRLADQFVYGAPEAGPTLLCPVPTGLEQHAAFFVYTHRFHSL